MKLKVEVISKEIIKPSSPTPHHLRRYQLSFLDQISPLVYSPAVLFYSNNDKPLHILSISNQLKKSLSHVLTHYYPLAGRMRTSTKSWAECNDEGIPYTEAKVKCEMEQVMKNRVPGELNHLLPFRLDDVTDIPFGVQLNVFDCGGIAITVCLSHQLADGLSLFTFLNSWAAINTNNASSGLPNNNPLQFLSAKLFPPRNLYGFDPRCGIAKEKIVCKIFVFGASAIEALRERYVYDNNEKRPTRVEALSAFIWSRYVAAVTTNTSNSTAATTPPPNSKSAGRAKRIAQAFLGKLKCRSRGSGPKRITHALLHTVNLRSKTEPPLPPNSFGNYYWIALHVPKVKAGEERSGLVKQVSEQIRRIDGAYVKKLQAGIGLLDFLKDKSYRILVKKDLDSLNFTSLCRFPLYDADFGWGPPTWVASAALTFKNLVVFFDAKNGSDIEAYISLKVEDMPKFEADHELLACVNKTATP